MRPHISGAVFSRSTRNQKTKTQNRLLFVHMQAEKFTKTNKQKSYYFLEIGQIFIAVFKYRKFTHV